MNVVYCAQCNFAFRRRRRKHQYCSTACRMAAYRKRKLTISLPEAVAPPAAPSSSPTVNERLAEYAAKLA